ncbi:MAG: CsbD family protein [Okeania sp. SIO2F4]|uniref:CsbD family protein n=1 Tax=Okeania sp. SIO2F4 TaxID=2607790 RepID=UPI00142CFB05|nr:CsbD family protein [Okeania sp. SIO2F4]NES03830.1 CsbD family protein [Okeania sp. SIO2F4]
MNIPNLLEKVFHAGRRLTLSLCLIFAMAVAWANLSINLYNTAHAATLGYPNFVAVIDSVIEDADTKGKNLLDKVAGEGTSNKIEGKVDTAVGKAQQELGNTKSQAEGLAKQAEGKAESDIGTVESTLEKSASEVQETSENIFDNVKSFFEQ